MCKADRLLIGAGHKPRGIAHIVLYLMPVLSEQASSENYKMEWSGLPSSETTLSFTT